MIFRIPAALAAGSTSIKRLQRQRRKKLIQEIEEVRQEASLGQIKFGSVEDFLKELDA